MKKEENQFHQEYLQGKREDQYEVSGKIIYWLFVFYAIAGGLYMAGKSLFEIIFK